eukprot:g211.t1
MASRIEPLALEALDVKIAFPAFEDATETPWDRYVMLNYLVRGRERRRRPLLDHGGRLSYWGIRNKNSTSEFFALTEEETLYHPAKYKTKMCTDVKKCREQAGCRLCPYAHSEEELRCELAKKYGYRDEFDTWRAKQKERDEGSRYGNSVTVEDLFQFPDGRIVVYSSLDGACYGIADVIRRSKKAYAEAQRREQELQRKTAGRDDVSHKCWDRAEAGVPHSSTSRSKSFRKHSTTSSARAMAATTNTSSTTALKGRKKGHWRNGGQGAESEAQAEGGGSYEGAHQSGGGGSASAARSRAAYNRSQHKQSVPSNHHPSQYNSRQSGPTTTGGIGQTLKPPLRVNTKVRSSYPHWYDRPVEFDRQYGWSWGGQKWGTHAYEERTWGRNSDSPRGGVHAANYASGGVLTGQPQAHYDEFGRSCRLDGGVLETYSCVIAGGAGTSTDSPGGNFPGDSRTRPIGTTEHGRREGRSASAAAAGACAFWCPGR